MPKNSFETMTKYKVFLPIHPSRVDIPDHLPEFQQFQEQFDVIVKKIDIKELSEWKNLFETELRDISAIWATNVFFRLPFKFNDIIDFFPKSLRVVVLPWVGHDSFDGAKLREKGIVLANAGEAPSKDVADIALQLTLGTFRYTSYFEKSLRAKAGNITEVRQVLGGTEVDITGEPLPPADEDRKNWTKYVTLGGKTLNSPAGKVVGLVGLGAIGKEIALRLWAIGMKIAYTKRSELAKEELESLPYKPTFYESFEDLIPHVDLLVLAVPHTPQTVRLINEDSISLFKKGVRIVNIGRGSAIDEDVLFKALDDGTVNSAGLDVFLNEPQIDKRFLNRHDVVILPHLGSFTVDNFRISTIRTIENIKDVILGSGSGISPVN
jgi:lactate dehydrogenase-like 2-hydroxyacid dehydrogenase